MGLETAGTLDGSKLQRYINALEQLRIANIIAPAKGVKFSQFAGLGILPTDKSQQFLEEMAKQNVLKYTHIQKTFDMPSWKNIPESNTNKDEHPGEEDLEVEETTVTITVNYLGIDEVDMDLFPGSAQAYINQVQSQDNNNNNKNQPNTSSKRNFS